MVFSRHLLALTTIFLSTSTASADAGQVILPGQVIPPRVYSCPVDNGVRYTTNGVIFELLCGRGTLAPRLDYKQLPSMAACADWCSESPECQSCDWNLIDLNCVRFAVYIPTIYFPTVNTWFPVQERVALPQPSPAAFDEPKCPIIPVTINEKTNAVQFADVQNTQGLCPTHNGKTYITKDGSYFKVGCVTHNRLANDQVFTTITVATLAECAEFCGITKGCTSANFDAPTYKCMILAGVPEIVPCPINSHSTVVLIDPPTYDSKDEMGVQCSTTCPTAHGNTFEDNGVAFRMSCCKRHGIVPFSVLQMSSFTECMSACSSVVSCVSVDYHERSGQCYFGKHFGEATVQAPGWASAYSIGCAGACKKGGACCEGQ